MSEMSRLVWAYQFFFVLGVTTFALATFATLPFYEQLLAKEAFNTLLTVSALCLITTELLELVAAPLPKWRVRLCLLAVLGQVTYLLCIESQEFVFNGGEMFIFGSFCYSLAEELKILALILEDRDFQRVLQKERNRFFQFGFLAFGTLFFLAGTIIVSLSDSSQKTKTTVGLVNSIGGVVTLLSLVMLLRREKHQGYKDVSRNVEVASVIEQS